MADRPSEELELPQSPGEWKQRILRIYNRIKREVSGTGVESQNIHLTDSYIMIAAVHNRVSALATITDRDAQLGRWADVAIIDANKARLRAALAEELGIELTGIFQDYDPVGQVAVTVALLAAPLPGGTRAADPVRPPAG